ncbi:MAG: hypothetical protein IJ852_00545 [Alphaproteobacteria bacterium]|nr:hypothetical protein [Alphaproteobacteria bacterium]
MCAKKVSEKAKTTAKKTTAKKTVAGTKSVKEKTTKVKSAIRKKSVKKTNTLTPSTEITPQKQEKSTFSLLSLLWDSQEKIRRLAENYSQIPWYKSTRFGAVFCYALLLFAATVLDLGFKGNLHYTVMFIWGCLVVIIPVIYLGTKGYRWLLFLVALSLIGGILNLALHAYFWIHWLFALVLLYLFRQTIKAFRIENYRIKNNLSAKKPIIKDILISIILPLTGAFLTAAGFAIHEYNQIESEQRKQEMFLLVGTVYNHTTGLVKYCQTAGYTIIRYDRAFKEKFSAAVQRAEESLPLLGLKAASLSEIKDIDQISYDAWQSDRRRLIAHHIMEEQGLSADNFVWLDIYDQRMPIAEFCRMLDENADMFVNKNSELDFLNL